MAAAKKVKGGSTELFEAITDHATKIDALEAAGNVGTADLETGAVTGAKIAAAALDQLVGTAGNGAGARTLTGAAVGDKVTAVINLTDLIDASAAFESTITVVNQIQQTATDYSSDKILVFLTKG
jgi:hypothetical protein